MSDTNAELVRLGNQVALLEEEKGNLQLSLVDFDELKGRNQDRNYIVVLSILLVMRHNVRFSYMIFMIGQFLQCNVNTDVLYIYLRVCVYVFTFIYVYACIYTHTCTYIHQYYYSTCYKKESFLYLKIKYLLVN